VVCNNSLLLKIEDIVTDPELNSRYWLVRKAVCLVAYYGGLRTNEIRDIEFNKSFSGGEKSFEYDSNGFWFTFERSKQRGKVELTTVVVPRRTPDWIPVVSETFRSPVDYDPASIIDEYLEVIQSDFGKSLEELEGPFFRSTHGVNGIKFSAAPLGVNTLGKIPVEFAMQLVLPNATSFTGHCWRRSCGTNASNAGVNVTTLMAQMGWSTPKTALGYVQKSKVSSFQMAMFLSNIQRQNKFLDDDGVKSTPKGKRLLKSDVLPRSALKKPVSLEVTEVGRIGRKQELSNPANSLAYHLIGAGTSSKDSEVRKVMSDLENRESALTLVDSVRSEMNVGHQPVVSTETDSSVENSIVQLNMSAASVDASSASLLSSSGIVSGMDARAAAILQNFQNNGSVQIHLHFHGSN